MKVISNDAYDLKCLLSDSKMHPLIFNWEPQTYIVIIWNQPHEKNDIQGDDNYM